MKFRVFSPRSLTGFVGLLALGLSGPFALAVDAMNANMRAANPMAPIPAAADYGDALNRELSQVSAQYDDVRKELDEEYRALKQERDDNAEAIFNRVAELKADRQAEMEQFNTEYREFERRMTDANISSTDKRYIDEANPYTLRQTNEQAVYDTAMANLQRMYRLNDERYNELLDILDAREKLEEERYRANRDYTAERLRFNRSMDRANMNDAAQRRVNQQVARLEEQKKYADARYDSSAAALDDLRNLIENKIKSQKDYLEQHQDIMQKITDAKGDTAQISELTADLHDLREKRDAEERKYRTNMRYLRERLTMEQVRNRELAQLDRMKMDMENRWNEQEQRIEREREALDQRLSQSNLTEQQKTALDAQKQRFDERYDQQKKAYDDTVKLIEQRRDLTERALDQRLAYLNDRNDIRLQIAESEASGENLAKFRDEINDLEEKRLSDERSIRNDLMNLRNQVPAMYRESPALRGNLEDRKQRSVERLDRMRTKMESRYETQKQRMQSQIDSLQSRLQDQNLSAEDRSRLQEQITQLQSMQADQEQTYNQMVSALDQRKQLENQRMENREKYLTQRAKILEEAEAGDVKYDSLEKVNQALRDLDAQWDTQESQYMQNLQPLQGIMPQDGSRRGWEARSERNWQEGVRRIDSMPINETRASSTRGTTGTTARERATRNTDDGAIVRGFKWLGAVIEDGYHDAVDYFTD